MKIGKAAEFLKKAVRALRGKASILRARLLFLASLRRRTAMVGAISHRIRALMAPGQGKAAARPSPRRRRTTTAWTSSRCRRAALRGIVDLSELLQEAVDNDGDYGGRGGGYPDWTHSLFDDDGDDNHDDDDERGDGEVVEELDDETSVVDIIRSRREGDGVEFNIEEEIDHAADMFIRRVRGRMKNRSF